ncbi:hypothetical protein ACFWOJ_22955 [Streptomyces sp. NPDC058439]|uniref:hypothetical protein n=1 Tax=Streptomyces sp. NPDC058439 TaxID=3346500 RepID=UPI003655B26B
MYPSLTRALAEALVDVLWFIDGSEANQMDQDDVVKVLEGRIAHLITKLSSDQRQELIDLLGERAEVESHPARREFLAGFPEGCRSDPTGDGTCRGRPWADGLRLAPEHGSDIVTDAGVTTRLALLLEFLSKLPAVGAAILPPLIKVDIRCS